jgi:DNA polymerase-3 subunit delta
LSKARVAGTSVGSILFAAQRQVAQLHKWKAAIEGGGSSSFDSLMPPPNFRRRNHIEAALRQWSAARLLTAMTELGDAVLLSRRSGDLASTVAERALLAIAANARRSAA